MASALILGPTGLVGSHLLALLLEIEDYDRVVALSRRPLELRHPKLNVVLSELADLGRHPGELQADDIFCCLGTTIRLAKTQEAFRAVDFEAPLAVARLQSDPGGKRYFLISSLGADARSPFFYTRVKGELEKELGHQGFKRVVSARPSLLLGQRREPRPGEMIGEWSSIPLSPLMRGPWRKYRPIQAATVAENMVKLARGQEPREGMEWALL